MFTYLAKHHLADAYEQYMLDHMGRDLQDFLAEFSNDAGIGIKTSIGMGGTKVSAMSASLK